MSGYTRHQPVSTATASIGARAADVLPPTSSLPIVGCGMTSGAFFRGMIPIVAGRADDLR